MLASSSHASDSFHLPPSSALFEDEAAVFYVFYVFFCLLVLLCFVQLNSNYLGFKLFVYVRDPLFVIFFDMSTQKKGEGGFKLVTSAS
jgi:hypothetical protein